MFSPKPSSTQLTTLGAMSPYTVCYPPCLKSNTVSNENVEKVLTPPNTRVVEKALQSGAAAALLSAAQIKPIATKPMA